MSRPLEWCTTEGRRGWDEELANAPRKVYDANGLTWSMVPPRRLVVLAGLPACGSCLRSAKASNRPLPDGGGAR